MTDIQDSSQQHEDWMPWPHYSLILFLHLFIYLLGAQGSLTKHVCGSHAPLTPVDPEDQTQVVRLGGECCHL